MGRSGLCHIALKVSDAQRSATFYERGLGLHRLQEQFDGQMVILVNPDRGDVMTISTGNVGAEVDLESASNIGQSGGIDHFGFMLPDGVSLDEGVARLVELGGTEDHRAQFAGIDSSFIRDLDGYAFQIWEAPGPVPPFVA